MGNYNPDVPYILGQEWVPIRDELLALSPQFDVIEQGHGFTLAQSRVLQDARFYIDDFPPGAALGQVYQAAVYPRGYEDNTGPIRSVIIPCNSAAVTGANAAPLGAVAALADPSDVYSVGFGLAGGTERLAMNFATASYPQLVGKRILAVNLLYSALGTFAQIEAAAKAAGNSPATHLVITSNAGPGVSYVPFTGPDTGENIILNPSDVTGITEVSRIRLGEINHWWSTSSLPSATTDRMPWRYDELLRLESS